MELLNDIQWYIRAEPKTALNKENMYKTKLKKNEHYIRPLTKKEFDTVVFDDSTKENVKLSFPLNDDYTFFVTREIQRPVTVDQLLTFIYKFYQEPLDTLHMEAIFGENEELKEMVLEEYDGDITQLKNYDGLDPDPAPDFCDLTYDESTGEYVVGIGPE